MGWGGLDTRSKKYPKGHVRHFHFRKTPKLDKRIPASVLLPFSVHLITACLKIALVWHLRSWFPWRMQNWMWPTGQLVYPHQYSTHSEADPSKVKAVCTCKILCLFYDGPISLYCFVVSALLFLSTYYCPFLRFTLKAYSLWCFNSICSWFFYVTLIFYSS